jgi:hypothetical protein
MPRLARRCDILPHAALRVSLSLLLLPPPIPPKGCLCCRVCFMMRAVGHIYHHGTIIGRPLLFDHCLCVLTTAPIPRHPRPLGVATVSVCSPPHLFHATHVHSVLQLSLCAHHRTYSTPPMSTRCCNRLSRPSMRHGGCVATRRFRQDHCPSLAHVAVACVAVHATSSRLGSTGRRSLLGRWRPPRLRA